MKTEIFGCRFPHFSTDPSRIVHSHISLKKAKKLVDEKGRYQTSNTRIEEIDDELRKCYAAAQADINFFASKKANTFAFGESDRFIFEKTIKGDQILIEYLEEVLGFKKGNEELKALKKENDELRKQLVEVQSLCLKLQKISSESGEK